MGFILVIFVFIFLIGLIAMLKPDKRKRKAYNKSNRGNYATTNSTAAFFAGPDSSDDCGSCAGGDS